MNHGVSRRGLTLLEVVIAVAIFTSVIALAFESLLASQRYQILGAAQDTVFADDAATIQFRLTADLATSGWHFHPNEDRNGNGLLDTGEDLNLDGALSDVDFSLAANDRKMLYFPYVKADTAATRGTAFPTHADPAVSSELARLSPWTATRYPGWSTAQIATDRDALVARALRQGVILTQDLAQEMVQPSDALVFLRVGVGPWHADPNEIDRGVTPDMIFFPTYSSGPAPAGAPASAWRVADNYANLPLIGTTQTVKHMSAYVDPGGTGAYVHRNSLLAVSDPDYNRPYGVPSWGAAINQGASGPRVRIQWETLLATGMYFDPGTGQDYEQPPADLRDYIYAVVPSPRGLGRLVRAHAVTGGGGTLGVEPGNWITATSASRGYRINLVLSDDVVRVTWTTRRHDPTLPANMVRARIVLARVAPEATTTDGRRQVVYRTIQLAIPMLAKNEYDDQIQAADLIDIPSSASNVPYAY